jgi:hypothetical protein
VSLSPKLLYKKTELKSKSVLFLWLSWNGKRQNIEGGI